MAHVIPLHLLEHGQFGPIVDIDGYESTVTWLNEMGVAIGKTLRIVQPGSPCIVAIGEARLSIRGEQCASIYVQVQ